MTLYTGETILTPSTQLFATVNLDAIAHNIGVMQKFAGDTQIMAVVKADAYGHGAIEVSKTALAAGAVELGCATYEEAMQLRNSGIVDAPVLFWLWGPSTPIEEALRANLMIAVAAEWQLDRVLEAVKATGISALLTAKLDTGMGRSGFNIPDWPHMVERFLEAEAFGMIHLRGLMAHFSSADELGNPVTDRQADALRAAIDMGRRAGLKLDHNHHANTAALLTHGGMGFELARPGLGIYGISPMPELGDLDLVPAMTWSGRVVLTKQLPEGTGVSYNHDWHAPTDTITGIVPCGYADGIDRRLANKLEVAINGRRFPEVGRISMDQIVVDLGPDGGGVEPHDEAFLFGDGSRGELTALDWADLMETIPYEVISMVGGRTTRRYEHRPVKIDPDTVPSSQSHPAGEAGLRELPHEDDTLQLGRELAAQLRAGDLVILDGALGAGKTVLARGIAQGLGVQGRVTSPSFVIARSHKPGTPGGVGMVHVDAYRLLDGMGEGPAAGQALLDELDALDLDTALTDSVVVVEWGGGLAERLVERSLVVTLARSPASDKRHATWRWVDDPYRVLP
ncbi:MAG TPA: alanine racemase [Corynebacteriales bacterium]|nr:alanine racemase [Mycobacteriales bacterium]